MQFRATTMYCSWLFFVCCLGLASGVLVLGSCSSQASRKNADVETRPKSAGVVRLLVVDDPPLAEAIDREWKARSDSAIEVKQTTTKNLLKLKKLAADAVIYPAGLLGELAERDLIVSVPDDVLTDPALARRDLLPLARQHEVSWGTKVYALSFGSPQLVVLYRADIFEKLKLQPPTTWTEYQSAAEKLSRRESLGDLAPESNVPWHGVCEPLGSGWASQTLLARAAGYVRHSNQFSALFEIKSMAPLIATEPFVKALEELVAAAKLGPHGESDFTPHDVRRELLAGHAGMALTWPTAAKIGAPDTSDDNATVSAGVVELPATADYYNFSEAKWIRRGDEDQGRVPLLAASGRLGSATKESRRAKAAFNVLVWLSGREWSAAIASQSGETTLYRQSHTEAPEAWVAKGLGSQALSEYAQAIAKANGRPVWLSSIRIPGRSRYLEALDEAVRQAVSGEKPAQESLTEAAQKWRAITQELGVEQQKRAYLRSLGIDP